MQNEFKYNVFYSDSEDNFESIMEGILINYVKEYLNSRIVV